METNEIVLYLEHLSKVYEKLGGSYLEVSICGGAALNLLGYVKRFTKDIDVVAPEELPEKFIEAAKITADYFGLKQDWINQGPVDLLRMGLPQGFAARCEKKQFHSKLIFLITSRIDQIHFKLYASIDRGNYQDQHVQDLHALKPNDEELEAAVKWVFTHDVSQPFKDLTLDFLKKNGWQSVEERFYK